MLKSYGWGGGPQDYCVSPSPLLAPLGPFGVGTGLDWVGIGSGGVGDSGVGGLGLDNNQECVIIYQI